MDEPVIENQQPAFEPKATESRPTRRLTPRQKKMIAIAAIIVIPLAAFFYFKSHFIAAVVDGKPISRLRVVQELERQGGKTVLEGLITDALIENESKERGITVSEGEIDDEVNKIKASVTEMGGTFEAALAEKGFTEESLRSSVALQLKMRKLLAEQIAVTDDEIEQYIVENEIELPEVPEVLKEQIRKELEEQKFSQEIQGLIAQLKAKADITYYVNY